MLDDHEPLEFAKLSYDWIDIDRQGLSVTPPPRPFVPGPDHAAPSGISWPYDPASDCYNV